MSYEVNILADSIHPTGEARLTTFEVVFPRFILAEVNTHRMLSRNSASSRAIPTERFISSILHEPFIPEFNQRVTGMGVGEPFTPEEQDEAEDVWLEARDDAVRAANALVEMGVDKSRANRLLEPFMWHTAIITATEWDNFFALRTDKGAQPEFRIIAEMMQDALGKNTPQTLDYTSWHLPLIESNELTGIYNWDELKQIAVGRLARRSSYNRTDPEPIEKSIERHDILSKNGHWSPFEHVARAMSAGAFDDLYKDDPYYWSGNFFGFAQYRKEFDHEDDFSKLKPVDLHNTTDAQVWAREFAKRFDPLDPPEPDDLFGWFANAIEAGRSAGQTQIMKQHKIFPYDGTISGTRP